MQCWSNIFGVLILLSNEGSLYENKKDKKLLIIKSVFSFIEELSLG